MVLCLSIMQLIDRGKVNVKEIASDIGISPDLLNTTLAVINFMPCNQLLKLNLRSSLLLFISPSLLKTFCILTAGWKLGP